MDLVWATPNWLVPGSTSSDMTEVGLGTWSVNRPQWKPFSSQDFLAVTP